MDADGKVTTAHVESDSASVRSSLRRLAGEVSALVAGLAGPRLVSLVTLPLLFYREGSQIAGAVVRAEAVVVYIPVIAGLAFAAYAQRFVRGHDRVAIIAVWQSSVWASMLLGLTGLVTIMVVRPQYSPIWLAAVVTAACQSCTPTWVMRALGEFRRYAMASVGWFALAVIVCAVGIYLRQPWMYFAGGIPGYFMVMWWSAATGIRPSLHFSPRLTLQTIRILPAQVAIQLYISIDVVIISALIGLPAAGVYGLLYRVQYALMAGYAVMQQHGVLRPKDSVIRASPLIGVVTFMLLGIGLAAFHPLLPQPFREQWRIIAILAGQFAIAATGLSLVLRLLTGPPMRYVTATVLAACVNVALNVLLLPQIGLRGAGLATVLSETVMVGIAFAIHRYTRRSPDANDWPVPSVRRAGLTIGCVLAVAAFLAGASS